MTGTVHLSYAEAYELKAGGFRGAAVNKLTGVVSKGEIRDTLAQAKSDAVGFVFAFADGRNMVTGTYRNPRNLWRCNYFIRADEIDA